ncbi:MAG TPA: AIR synthase family protein [Candidatus Eubacterium pullicola]|nr:AIR synthase family protein [Candidatus Eubacterium pullicola]
MLEIGKIDSELLKKIVFDKITYRRPEVKTRPGIGEDCAVVDFGQCDCVMSTDPITAAVNEIGRLAIHITCNDIASNGVRPVGIMLAAMLPPGTTEEDIALMMEQAGKTAAQVQVEIIGGHTEITAAVNKPVIVSTAIGISCDSEKNSHKNMKPGDTILLTKRAGIEGAGVIANDNEEKLKEVLTDEELEIAKGFLNEVSVVEEGVAAGSVGTCGMHDVTEGGVLGAIWEMCTVEGKGALVYKDRIPVDSVTEKIAKFYDIDWLRLISSGCMLIVASREKKDDVIKAVEDAGVAISEIGVIASPEDGIMIEENGIKSPVEPPASDELYKAVK